MRKIFICMMLAMTSFAFAENKMSVADITITAAGESEDLIVSLDDDFDVYAYDFRIYLPEGFSINKWPEDEGDDPEDWVYMFKVSRMSDYNKDIRVADDGSLQIGISNGKVKSSSGEIFRIRITAGDDVADGTYEGWLKKASLSDETGDLSVILEDVKFNIIVGDGTGINNMTPDMNAQLKNSVIFNALGQRIQNAVKGGLYIVGGKKFIKK